MLQLHFPAAYPSALPTGGGMHRPGAQEEGRETGREKAEGRGRIRWNLGTKCDIMIWNPMSFAPEISLSSGIFGAFLGGI